MTEAIKPIPPKTLIDVIEEVLLSGRITRNAQLYLNAAAWSDMPLSLDEQEGIKEVCDRLQKGWVRVVD